MSIVGSLLISLLVLLAGVALLVVGIKIMSRRPIIVSLKVVQIILIMLCLFLLISSGLVIIEFILGDLGSPILLTVLLSMSVPLVPFMFFTWSLSRSFVVYNVTPEMLIDSMSKLFHQNEIAYAWRDTTTKLSKKLLTLSQITFYLPELSNIVKINISPLGFAWVKVKKGLDLIALDALLHDYKDILSRYKCDVALGVGIYYILMGIAIDVVIFSLLF